MTSQLQNKGSPCDPYAQVDCHQGSTPRQKAAPTEISTWQVDILPCHWCFLNHEAIEPEMLLIATNSGEAMLFLLEHLVGQHFQESDVINEIMFRLGTPTRGSALIRECKLRAGYLLTQYLPLSRQEALKRLPCAYKQAREAVDHNLSDAMKALSSMPLTSSSNKRKQVLDHESSSTSLESCQDLDIPIWTDEGLTQPLENFPLRKRQRTHSPIVVDSALIVSNNNQTRQVSFVGGRLDQPLEHAPFIHEKPTES